MASSMAAHADVDAGCRGGGGVHFNHPRSGHPDRHQHHREPKLLLKECGNGDRPTFAQEERLAPKGVTKGFRGSLQVRLAERRDERVTISKLTHLDFEARRRSGTERRFDERADLHRVLPRNQAARDLRMRMGRDDRLGAIAHESAPDAIDVQGRPPTASLRAMPWVRSQKSKQS